MIAAALWTILVLVLIAAVAFLFWDRISPWVRDSETLFTSRLMVVVGAIGSVIAQTDMGPVLVAFGLGKYAPIILLLLGFFVEIARKLRASDL